MLALLPTLKAYRLSLGREIRPRFVGLVIVIIFCVQVGVLLWVLFKHWSI